MPHEGPGSVVVGVDCTPRSERALRWAAEEACRLGTDVVAVHACPTERARAPYAPARAAEPRPDERLAAEAEHLADTVREALGDRTDVVVRQVCRPTTPVRALLSHAEGAALLVLATDGGSGNGPAIGPTALACLRSATCPILILPAGSAA